MCPNCNEASADLHFWGMAELTIVVNNEAKTLQFWGNHLKVLIPEMPALCMLSGDHDLDDYIIARLPPAGNLKGRIAINDNKIVGIVM